MTDVTALFEEAALLAVPSQVELEDLQPPGVSNWAKQLAARLVEQSTSHPTAEPSARDRFAAAACGSLTRDRVTFETGGTWPPVRIAEYCFLVADRMIA